MLLFFIKDFAAGNGYQACIMVRFMYAVKIIY